jgi:hypothetical protein
MNSAKDEIKKALSRRVIPELRRLEFKGTFPHFRRVSNGKLNLFTFQFDKYGGGFIIEIANCNLEGYTTSWGREIKPNKITVYDLPKRKRIYANVKSDDTSTDNWYRYDRTSLEEFINIYESICDDVLSNMGFVEDYWGNGEIN